MADPFPENDLKEILFASLWLGVVAVGSLSAIFALGASSSVNLTKFQTFFIPGIISMLALITVKVLQERGFFQKAENRKWAGFQFITIHSPSNTFIADILDRSSLGNKKWVTDPVNLILAGTIVFAIAGLFIGQSGQISPQTPDFVQGSISQDAGNLFFGVEPVVTTETLTFQMFSQGLLIGLFFYALYSRLGLNYSESVYGAKAGSIIPATMLGVGNHMLRYGLGQRETAIVGIFFLWLTLSVLFVLLNSVILPYLFHFFGNFFDKLARMGTFANESITAIAFGIILMAILVALLLRKPKFLFEGLGG
jgi:hypothetical protein